LIEIRAIELLDLMKECYFRKLVDIQWTGPFQTVEKDIALPQDEKQPLMNIF